MSNKATLQAYFQKLAPKRQFWKRRNSYYHKSIVKYLKFIVPANQRVLELGCGTGELLNNLEPSYGLGVDFSDEMLRIAAQNYPQLVFKNEEAEKFESKDKFDYVIMSDLFCSLWDAQQALKSLKSACTPQTKIVITNYNYLWEPWLKLAEFLHLKAKQPIQNWLLSDDIRNLLNLEDYEVIKSENKLLLPLNIPLLSFFANRIVANLPLINKLCLISVIVARPKWEKQQERSVSIVVPARNERGNIENAILRTPLFGSAQEFIFIEGHSKDGTWEEILRIKEKYSQHNIVAVQQTQKGKGNAVREAFEIATGEVLMILDADLTMPPEELPKYYAALVSNKGEFINGCRLVYPMEKEAMRFLNLLGNRFFGLTLSYMLSQKLKDTLCGTKVLLKSDYERIKSNRSYFGEFDPFGDFDLLFGAAKLNLKITEIVIRYKDREYGSTQISRFSHGLLLLRMCWFASRKIKFI